MTILQYWPWLLLPDVLGLLPLAYIALEVAAAELLEPGSAAAALDELEESYVRAVARTIPHCPTCGGLGPDGGLIWSDPEDAREWRTGHRDHDTDGGDL